MNMNVSGERMWPGVVEAGIASIGWDELGDLRRSSDEIKQDLVGRVFGENLSNWVRFLRDFANGLGGASPIDQEIR